MLVATLFVQWIRRGPGSTLRGFEVADLLTSTAWSIPGQRLLGASLYLFALAGVGAIICSAARWRWLAAARLAVATPAILLGVGIIASGKVPIRLLSVGPWLGITGAFLVAASAVFDIVRNFSTSASVVTADTIIDQPSLPEQK